MKDLKGTIVFLSVVAFLLAIPVSVIISTQLIKAYQNQVYYEKLSTQTSDARQKITMLDVAQVNKALVKDKTEKLVIAGGIIVFVFFLFRTQRVET